MAVPDDQTRALLVEQVRRALIHELGARQVEVWLGKDGIHRHSTLELAEITVEALRPVLTGPGVADRVQDLHASGVLAPPVRLDPQDW